MEDPNKISLEMLNLLLNTPDVDRGISNINMYRYLELLSVVIEKDATSVEDAASIVRGRKVDFENFTNG